MKKLIDDFLMKDSVLYFMPWIFAVFTILLQGAELLKEPEIFSAFDLGVDVINIVLAFGIACSYRAHEKNIMKMLFGSMLTARIIANFYYTVSYFKEPQSAVDIVFSILFLLLCVLLFLNHLILGCGHAARPRYVNLNRAVGLLIILTSAVWNFAVLETVSISVMMVLYEASSVIEILCIETKVDAYRSMREKH